MLLGDSQLIRKRGWRRREPDAAFPQSGPCRKGWRILSLQGELHCRLIYLHFIARLSSKSFGSGGRSLNVVVESTVVVTH